MADETNELSLTEDERSRGADLVSVAAGTPLMPTTFEGAWRLAKLFVLGRMVPKSYLSGTKDENIAAVFTAMQYGLSVGLDPATSLQCIASINGVPGLHSMGPLGVVRRSNKMESHREWLEGTIKDGTLTAYCEVKRKGDAEPVKVAFTMAQAKTARLWGKSGPWSDYPEDMMMYKARNRALKRVFPDVLMGAGLADDFEPTVIDVTPLDRKEAPPEGTQDGARLPRRGAAPKRTEPEPKEPDRKPEAAPKTEPPPETPTPKPEPPKAAQTPPAAPTGPGAPDELPWS